MTTKTPKWLLRHLAAAHDTDAERETFAPGRLADPALGAAFAPADLAILARRQLDIWAAFDGAASSTSAAGWNAATYAGWIAGIDSLLAAPIAAGEVTRADLGASSDPTRHVYAYTAGATRAPHVLLIGGMHANEVLSQRSAMRWFEQFATGTHPMMRTLRATLRVTWIPTLNPAGYLSGRGNANGVDLSRNFDFYWARYTAPTPEKNKGGAAFSEVETQMIKTLCDNNKIAALIDCHTTTSPASTRDAFEWVSPGPLVHSRRDLAFTAGSLWDQIYNVDNIPAREMTEFGDYSSVPFASNWAALYLRYTKQRYNTAAVNIESPEQWKGSTATNMSRAAVRHYCGYITLWITEWLTSGQTALSVPSYAWYALRNTFNTSTDSTALDAGGTRLAVDNTDVAIWFDQFDGTWENRNYIDLAMPSPGVFEVRFDGYLEASGPSGGRVDAYFASGLAPSTAAITESATSVIVPSSAGARAAFSGSFRVSVQTLGQSYQRFQLLLNKRYAGGDPPLLRKARLIVRNAPNEVANKANPTPIVPRVPTV